MGISMLSVRSSNLSAIGRDGEDLIVKFTNGRLYRYRNVPAEVYGELVTASGGQDPDNTVGKVFNRIVRNSYEYEQIGGES